MIRTAFVLGAGLGTRLKALTARRPKPLIPVGGRPLITHAFDHLLDAQIGIERFVVNTHWRAERYAEFFPEAQWRGVPIHFVHEEPEVLETAGGLWNARAWLSDEPFIVYNGDIFTDLPLARADAHHAVSGNEVTMILRTKDGPLQVAFDEASGRVTDIGGRVDPAREARFLFTGIYFVNPAFLRRIPPATKISVVPLFCEMIRTRASLGGLVIDDGHWHDLGTREQYLAVHRRLSPGPWIAASAHISAHAELHECVVWENAQVAADARLTRCIVTDGAHATGTHEDADF